MRNGTSSIQEVPRGDFDGRTFEPKRDGARLTPQLEQVRLILLDGKPHTVPELKAAVGAASDASITARIRDLRKDKFGGYDIPSHYVSRGVWAYTMKIAAQGQLFPESAP